MIMTIPAALSVADRVVDGAAAVTPRGSGADGCAVSASGAPVCGAGAMAGASRDDKPASADGAGTRQSGRTKAVSGTSAAAAIALVQTKWRAEADARRITMVSTHARPRTTVARRQKPKNTGIRSVDTSGSFLARAFDHGRETLEVLGGQLLRVFVEQRRDGLRRRALEKRVEHVPHGRALGALALDRGRVDVACAVLLVADVSLVFEDPQERAHRRVARGIRHRSLHVCGGRAFG